MSQIKAERRLREAASFSLLPCSEKPVNQTLFLSRTSSAPQPPGIFRRRVSGKGQTCVRLEGIPRLKGGGITNPSNNLKLSQVIERAKKANMPVASIKSFLDRMEARKKNKTQTNVIEVRGPNGYIMLVCYITNNPKFFLTELNSKLKKTKGKTTNTSAKNMFIHTSNIIVKKKGNLEQAMEDAINIGAEDVEEFMENDMEYFQFKCDPKLLNKIKCLLKDREYYVLLAEEDYVPQTTIELNESDLEAVSQIRERVLSLEDVNKIYDNLA
ncbi:Translational activator of cytochrome c oxidase 1 [Atta colombica]|uniref:Translational activator of cytochrome c oxidase 1 n=1 Tax=Atta colombica TaxID=520822 RepID=A0A195BM56_9HYME|nr:Translational activator of cytochrome c oxidase 1 [Atta colombica]